MVMAGSQAEAGEAGLLNMGKKLNRELARLDHADVQAGHAWPTPLGVRRIRR
jgi:hypothetical protein